MGELGLPTSVLVGALAGVAYLFLVGRHREARFTLIDTATVVAIMVVVTALTASVVGKADQVARSAALEQNLRILRNQIELYKAEHGGRPPVLFHGTFPQLIAPTNSLGFIGPGGKDYPYGPYLAGGIPVNPYTGSSKVVAVDEFPPSRPLGLAGWLYHAPTGRISPDFPRPAGSPAEDPLSAR